jgi:hypothetical protein
MKKIFISTVILLLAYCGIASAWTFAPYTPNTVIDIATGDVWQKVVPSYARHTWLGATFTCQGLNLDGLANWELPTRDQIERLWDCYSDHPCLTDAIDGSLGTYWTATEQGDYATAFTFTSGSSGGYDKDTTLWTICVSEGGVLDRKSVSGHVMAIRSDIGLPWVEVNLKSSDDVFDLTTWTDPCGFYQFRGLFDGDYSIAPVNVTKSVPLSITIKVSDKNVIGKNFRVKPYSYNNN